MHDSLIKNNSPWLTVRRNCDSICIRLMKAAVVEHLESVELLLPAASEKIPEEEIDRMLQLLDS